MFLSHCHQRWLPPFPTQKKMDMLSYLQNVQQNQQTYSDALRTLSSLIFMSFISSGNLSTPIVFPLDSLTALEPGATLKEAINFKNFIKKKIILQINQANQQLICKSMKMKHKVRIMML